MTIIISQFIFYALLVIIAGIILSKSSEKFADITGLGKMFVGSILLASATSLPELFVDIQAVRSNIPDLAVGDLLGSSLFNLMILCLCDLFLHIEPRVFSLTYRHHAGTATVSILLTSLIGFGILSRSGVEYLGINWILWIVIAMYIWSLNLIKNVNGVQSSAHPVQYNRKDFILVILGYIFGIIILTYSAPQLVITAKELSLKTGIGTGFIGSTLIAITTSLPELSATIIAFRMGSPDLALGNIFGSNTFNMLLFVPLDFLYPGSLLSQSSKANGVTAFAVIITSSLVLFSYLFQPNYKRKILQPGAHIVLLFILISLYLIYQSHI